MVDLVTCNLLLVGGDMYRMILVEVCAGRPRHHVYQNKINMNNDSFFFFFYLIAAIVNG